jgi:hypothetical protein
MLHVNLFYAFVSCRPVILVTEKSLAGEGKPFIDANFHAVDREIQVCTIL